MRWIERPVRIRITAKRTNDERYRRTKMPNMKVGLRSAIAQDRPVVWSSALYALCVSRQDEHLGGLRGMRLLRQGVPHVGQPFALLQWLSRNCHGGCAISIWAQGTSLSPCCLFRVEGRVAIRRKLIPTASKFPGAKKSRRSWDISRTRR
jgi:hypothetical protein